MSILDELKDAVIKAVKKQFPAYDVFGETIEEGLRKPSFHVAVDEFMSKQCGVNRYRQSVKFKISYIPGSKKTTRECADVALQLIPVLSHIKCGGGEKYRGDGFGYVIKNDVLEFEVNINYFAVLDSGDADNNAKMGKFFTKF